MELTNLWSLTPDQRSGEEVELALLGLRTGDQIVKDAIHGFHEDLTAIFERQAQPMPELAHA